MNRLDPDNLKTWRAHYLWIIQQFCNGSMEEYDAMHHLMDLNFKGQALEVEIIELKREKVKWQNAHHG